MADRVFHTEVTADAAQFNAEMERSAQNMLNEGQRMQSDWRSSMFGMGQAAGDMVRRTNDQFDTLKNAVVKLRGIGSAIGAALFGGKGIGHMVDGSAEAAIATEKLALVLNTTTQEAKATHIALSDILVDAGVYTTAVERLTTAVRDNEERANALGVVTRDQQGNWVSTADLVQNALKALMDFKAGTDRNLASSELFGKKWSELHGLLRLTPEVMEAARVKAEALETVTGPEGVARARAYMQAKNDVKDVIEALYNRIAQGLMPALTDLYNWFASLGPAAVTVIRGALGGLLTVFYGLQNGVVAIVRTISAALFTVIEPLAGLSEAIALAMTGRFAEAGARLKSIPANIGEFWKTEFDEITKSSDETRKRIEALFDLDAEQGSNRKPDAGDKNFKPKDTGRTGQWEAELAAQRDAFERMKLEQGSFQEFGKARERDYWKNILGTQELSKDERVAVLRKYYEAERDVRKQAFETEIGELKARAERYKQGSQERIDLASQAARKIGERFGQESKEYKAAQADVIAAARERQQMLNKIAELQIEAEKGAQTGAIELERQMVEDAARLGMIKGQNRVNALRRLTEIEFQIEYQAEVDRAGLYALDELAYAQHLERLRKIKEKHTLDLKKLDGEAAAETKKQLDTWLDPISNSIQTMVNGMLMGTQKMRDIVRNALMGIASSYIATLIRMGVEWIKMEILKSQATTAGVATRTGVEAAGAATTVGINVGTATTSIGLKAWEAAAGVYAAIASIPFVGPFLAPAMAVAAAATVMGFVGRLFSAEQGFNVPSGMNPVTQLHEEEMVLPKDIANPLRDQLSGGGMGGGGDTFVIHTLDGRSLERYLKSNASSVAPAIRKLSRTFSPTKRN